MSGPDYSSKPPPTLDPGMGEVDNFGGLKAYVVGAADSKDAVVLVSDVFGYGAPNLRKLADKLAAAGFYVVVPDFFYGDPRVPGDDDNRLAWHARHGMDKGLEDAKSVVDALKERGVSAIGAAGFCWGGKPVVELAKLNYINAAVLAHPSAITVEDFEDVKCHTCILGAEIDQHCSPSMLQKCGEILSTKSEVSSYVKIFPGVGHGWTMRYEVGDKPAIQKAEEAHKDMLDWFVKCLL